MNTKLRKLLKLTAAGLFLVALAINVKVTLEDPFVMMSEQAIATGTSTDGTGTCTGAGTGTGVTICWGYDVVDSVPEDIDQICGGVEWTKIEYYNASGTLRGSAKTIKTSPVTVEASGNVSSGYSYIKESSGNDGGVCLTGKNCPRKFGSCCDYVNACDLFNN